MCSGVLLFSNVFPFHEGCDLDDNCGVMVHYCSFTTWTARRLADCCFGGVNWGFQHNLQVILGSQPLWCLKTVETLNGFFLLSVLHPLQVIIDSQPLTVAILASLLFGETISLVGASGLALGVVGLLLLEVRGVEQNEMRSYEPRSVT